jgi:hypothetical protein
MIKTCIEKNLSIKLSKWAIILLNLFIMTATVYIFKQIWTQLKEDEQEINESEVLPKPEVSDLLEIISTRRAVVITVFISVLILALIGLIGAIRLNTCLIAIYDIFCILVFILLALGFKNYIKSPIYYFSVLSLLLVAAIVASYLVRAIKEEPQWIRHRLDLLDPRDSF